MKIALSIRRLTRPVNPENVIALRPPDCIRILLKSIAAAFVSGLLLSACGGSDSNGGDLSSVDNAARRNASPVAVITPSASDVFYGINGHNNYGGPYRLSTPDVQLTQLQNLGVKMYRNEVFSQSTAVNLAQVAKIMAAGGVTVYPVILMGIDFENEDAAYRSAYSLGRQIASVQRYPYYEVTNELAAQCLVGWVDGVRSTDFDNAKFRIARGVIRGLIAGIKSIDSRGKIILGGNTWMHYGFNVMLANGTQPDGTSGHPVVTWDITAWHWYSDMRNIENACGGTGCYNVIGTLAKFGKPIWLTEIGARPNFGTVQQQAAYLTNDLMSQLVWISGRYNIQSIQVYQLYDDPPTGEGPYGILQNDGKTPKPAYDAMKNFIASHPK